MKKLVILIVLLTALTISAQAFVIWDFDSLGTSPVTVKRSGLVYVYASSTTNSNGIGGSHALSITLPLSTLRGFGGSFNLSNTPNWGVGSTNMLANNIDLSGIGNNTVFWSIMANDTSPNWGGIAFGVRDTSGAQFIPSGAAYESSSAQFTTISDITSGFQQVSWDLSAFHVYSGARQPALANLNSFEFFFPCIPGQPSGKAGLKFYLDDVGAIGVAVPIELSSFEISKN